jgi:hypothetical protein
MPRRDRCANLGSSPGVKGQYLDRQHLLSQWNRLNEPEARALRLLNFIAFDFSDPAKSALETLAEDGRLAAYVEKYKHFRNEWRLHSGQVRLSNDQ